jgi:hypothetical protein
MAWVCKSEDNLLESVLSFHQWGPSGLAQVTSLGIKYPYLLSHLAASPFIYIYIDVYLFACTLSFKSFFAGACVVCTFVCVFVCVYVCAYMCVHVCMEARVWCWMSLLIVLHHIYWGRVSYFNPDLTYLASLKLLWGPLPACPQVLDSRKVPKLLAFICVLEIQTPVHHIHRVISSAPRIFFKRKASLVHYIYGPWVSVEMQILESE